MVCSSVVGRGHLAGYRECQDAFRCNFARLVDPRNLSAQRSPQPLVAALSDGLGSARNSAAGAALTASIAQEAAESAFGAFGWPAATPRLLQHTLRHTLDVALDHLGESVRAIAANAPQPCPEASFAATLLVVVFRPPWLLVVNIGDGFVVAQRARGQLLMVSRPYVSAAEAGAVTSALATHASENADIICLCDPEITGLAASTDGLQDVSLEWEKTLPTVPHPEFFGPFFSGIADGSLTSLLTSRFLHQERIGGETADDLTLLAMARASEV